MVERFQNEVRKALDYFHLYNYHAPDLNIRGSNMHTWTLTKDADFIVANQYGRIGWIEVKNMTGPRFYVSQTRQNQWSRACELHEKFGTYYYIVNFKDYETAYWFTPSLVLNGRFDPIQHKENVIVLKHVPVKGPSGQTYSRHALNLLMLPFFQHPNGLAEKAPVPQTVLRMLKEPPSPSTK